MSADTRPISPARFAAALKDLSPSMLHLKVLEIRNSIAHLQYSNDQLRPFAEGTAIALGDATTTTTTTTTTTSLRPDQDCIDAIRENEAVIDRMAERIALVRAEVELRGISWDEFRSEEETEPESHAEEQQLRGDRVNDTTDPGQTLHAAWTDGTFQTGTVRNGELRMDSPSAADRTASTGTSGGRLSDEELRRAMEERMRNLDHDEQGEGGLHL